MFFFILYETAVLFRYQISALAIRYATGMAEAMAAAETMGKYL